MKMSREHLKGLIKECLVEILSEGLNSPTQSFSSQLQERRSYSVSGTSESKPRPQQPQNRKFNPALDTPISRNHQQSQQTSSVAKQLAAGNKVMESIFEDTAKTTLVEQTVVDGHSKNIVQQEQFVGNPEDVFASSAGKWANLAFAPSTKKISM